MCDRNTKDPLAARLYRDEGLCLVKVARTPDELRPGSIIVTFPGAMGREAVVHAIGDILVGAPAITLTQGEYRPLTLTESSNSVGVEVMVDVSGLVGADDKAAFEGALTAEGARKFKLVLNAGLRADLDVGQFEVGLAGNAFTDAARSFLDRGCGIYVVTRTVLANELQITGDGTMSAAAFAAVPAVAEAKLKVNARGRNVLRMQKASSEMVIGFKALKIEDLDGELVLNGMERKLDLRGKKERAALAIHAEASEFAASDDDIFAALAP